MTPATSARVHLRRMRLRPLPLALSAVGVCLAFAGAGFTRQAIEHRRACPGPDLLVRDVVASALPRAATTGRLLVAHDRPGDASIVDLATGVVTYIRLGFTDPHETAVSPDGRWGLVSDFGARQDGRFQGHRVAVIDLNARRVHRIIDLRPSRGAHGVAFIPGGDGRALVTAQSTREVVMLDVPRGTVVARMASGADGSHLLAVAQDGRYAFTANEGDGSVSRFDLRARRFDVRFPVAAGRAEGIAMSADGSKLLVGGTDPGVVYVVNPASGSLAISPDGSIAFLPGDGAHLDVVDVARPERIRRVPLPARPQGVSWGPAASAGATRTGTRPSRVRSVPG